MKVHVRKGEGVINRAGYIDAITADIHQINSDLKFFEEQLADREIVTREYMQLHQFKRALVMILDKSVWKLRIRQAKKAKRRLIKLSRRASSWL